MTIACQVARKRTEKSGALKLPQAVSVQRLTMRGRGKVSGKAVSFDVIFSHREMASLKFLLLVTLYFLLCTKYKNANPKSTDQ